MGKQQPDEVTLRACLPLLVRADDAVLLQFGRVGKDLFTMDFQWPLSPLQGERLPDVERAVVACRRC